MNTQVNQNVQDMILELQQFGFDQKYINQVVQLTSDKERAIELIIQMQEDEQNQQQKPQSQNQMDKILPFNIDFSTFQIPDFNQPQKRYKMVFLVRSDLKMGIGKIAAQTGHANLRTFLIILIVKIDSTRLVEYWVSQDRIKDTYKVDSLEELLDYVSKAQAAKINTYVVQDAGRTQVEPGSMTVAAIGPDEDGLINQVTGNLKLL